jgi:hypothetical protein
MEETMALTKNHTVYLKGLYKKSFSMNPCFSANPRQAPWNLRISKQMPWQTDPDREHLSDHSHPFWDTELACLTVTHEEVVALRDYLNSLDLG